MVSLYEGEEEEPLYCERRPHICNVWQAVYDTNCRWFAQFMEKMRVAVDCVFTAWFIMGNVWVFNGHSSSESSNFCRFVVILLTFCCMSCALPLVLCTALCCYVPSFVRVLGFEEEEAEEKGVSEDVLAALPVHTFKQREELSGDAACCICLMSYSNGARLRELPCSHRFHVDCVDQWLRISAICPLCKHAVCVPTRLTLKRGAEQEEPLSYY